MCIAAGDSESLMNHYVLGDKHADQVLECLSHIVTVYGQHVIVLQYLHHIKAVSYTHLTLPTKRIV